MSELKPCPFCGGQAEIERKGTARQSMQIACDNCGCRMESSDVFGLTNSDKWSWNRRSSIDCELDAARAHFRRACEKLAVGRNDEFDFAYRTTPDAVLAEIEEEVAREAKKLEAKP